MNFAYLFIMVGNNKENFYFIQFPNATSHKRNHDHQNTKFCCERGFHLLGLVEKVSPFAPNIVMLGGITYFSYC